MPEQGVARRVARAQELRHVIANKLTLPLTVLRELNQGRAVPPRLLERAIKELEAIMTWVDQQSPPR